MSDTSLNELQSKLIKLDKSDEESNLLSNIKKTNSIFVVPAQQSTNLTTVTLLNDTQKANTNSNNKIHVVPFNLNSTKSTPIKIIQDLNATSPVQSKATIISSIGNSKKLIQINSTSPTNTSMSPIRANNIIINSSDKSPQSNPKILTITNGLNSNANSNNKIQYVKIVNTPSVTSSSPNSTGAIKFTTISANSSNATNSNSLQDGSTNRSIISSITPTTTTIKTIQKPIVNSTITNSTVSLKQSNSEQPTTPLQTSVLFDAINNSPNLNETFTSQTNKTSNSTTTTIQLVNTNQSQGQSQRGQVINQKTSIIQRIQSFPTSSQSITKTIVTASPATSSLSSSPSNQSTNRNYKVLSQQFKNNNNNVTTVTNNPTSSNPTQSVPNSPVVNKTASNNQQNNSVQTKSPSFNDSETLKLPVSSKAKIPNQQTSPTNMNQSSTSGSSNTRKPCNCTKSMCLKLYCDCFAQGSFCHDCNCINCFNTLEHEDERNKAIKMVLERNPQAFQSKIGKFTASIALSKVIPPQITPTQAPNNGIEDLITASNASEELDEIQSRHVKGCNCKKSNCLKRYCECYLAKIQCSALCKCVGCKNCDESTRTLLQLANAADLRKQQQQLEQKQQLTQQQQQVHTPSLGLKIPLSNPTNNASLFNGSFKKFKHFDALTEGQQLQLEQQQSINRAYMSVLNTNTIKETCERLISKVLNEIESVKMQTDDEEEAKIDENTEIEMEKCLIEQFSECLVDLIKTVEST